MIIAIDGPAGAGKSTVAREVALALGFAYINTGAMYRAVALEARARALDPKTDEAEIAEIGRTHPMRFGAGGTRLFVGDTDVSDAITAPEMGEAASKVASLPRLRAEVVARQHEMGRLAEAECGGAVLEGRDIQTVVFPDAPLKVFLTATDEARAQRRIDQWKQKGHDFDAERALLDVRERDARDASRDTSPLRPADDAVILLSDDLTAEQVIEQIVNLARERMTS
ncbi:(d)CMP kinase [bacterium]|nr:MAG: (d)CMP kinase [bacterium]